MYEEVSDYCRCEWLGKVAADIATRNSYEEILFLDDDTEIKDCLGFPIVGQVGDIESFSGDFFVAIGNPTIREEIQNRLERLGKTIVSLIHPSAVVGHAVTIECANSTLAPEWRVSGLVLRRCIDLCIDICKRNGNLIFSTRFPLRLFSFGDDPFDALNPFFTEFCLCMVKPVICCLRIICLGVGQRPACRNVGQGHAPFVWRYRQPCCRLHDGFARHAS